MSSFKSSLTNFLDKIVYPAVDKRMNASGESWKAEAKRLCPVRTGKLRDSISYIYRQSDRTLILFCDQPYGLFLELGTRRMAARPFMRPAMAKIGKIWGVTVEAQFTMAPEKYIPRARAFTTSKLGGKTLHFGHIEKRKKK